MHSDRIRLVARANDLYLRSAVCAVSPNRLRRKSDRRGRVCVVVRDHQRQRVAGVAHLAAQSTYDREQAHLRKLRQRVVRSRHADVFDRFVVRKGQLKFAGIVIAVKFQRRITELFRDFKILRKRLRFCILGNIRLAEHGMGTEQRAVLFIDTAKVHSGPFIRIEVPEIAPQNDQFVRFGVRNVLPAVPVVRLPAIPVRLRRLRQGQYDLVRLRNGFRNVGNHHAEFRRRHVAHFVRNPERLIRRYRVRILIFDQNVLFPGRRVVINVFRPVLIRGDCRHVVDANDRLSDRPAVPVHRDQQRLRDRFPVLGHGAGLGDIRLMIAEGERAERKRRVPVLVFGDPVRFGRDRFGRDRRR